MLTHFFSAGFRPMFLLGALWSALCVVLWIHILIGRVTFEHPWAPLDWHVHEMVFGYGSAALSGFLLTAIPHWTGRDNIKGAALAGLVVLWLAGRLAVFYIPSVSPTAAAVIDVSFMLTLLALSTREILASGNTRNLPVMAILLIFTAANLAFHWQAAGDTLASQSASARFGIAALVLLISLIGGRIVPMFTRNWLKARGIDAIPPAFNQFDGIVLILTAPALLLWAMHPSVWVTAIVLGIAGGLHILRMARWRASATRHEPLLLTLHIGYGFVPLGFLLLSLSLLSPSVAFDAGLHAWSAGAIGVMTLTVMTRASLGHSGRPLKAHPVETGYLALIVFSAMCRVCSGLVTDGSLLLQLSSVFWALGFLLFVLRFARIMFQPRLDMAAI